jgi:hypothetical protein
MNIFKKNQTDRNRIGVIIVTVLASSTVDRGFEPLSGQTKEIGICCFSAEHAELRRKSKACMWVEL